MSVNPSQTLTPPAESLRLGAWNPKEIAALSRRLEETEFLARRRAAAWAHG